MQLVVGVIIYRRNKARKEIQKLEDEELQEGVEDNVEGQEDEQAGALVTPNYYVKN